MSFFICILYSLCLGCCLLGLYNNRFNANFLQRVALVMFAFWSTWRIWLVYQNGWGYPHEPLIATALSLFAVGTITKTISWKYKT